MSRRSREDAIIAAAVLRGFARSVAAVQPVEMALRETNPIELTRELADRMRARGFPAMARAMESVVREAVTP